MKIATALILLSQLSAILPVLVLLRRFRLLNFPFKLLAVFSVANVIFEYCASIIKYLSETGNNMMVSYTFSVIEVVFLVAIFLGYRKVYGRKLLLKVGVFFIGFLALTMVDISLYGGVKQYNSLSKGVECVILCAFALVFFVDTIRQFEAIPLFERPMFWFSSAILIYFSLIFFGAVMMNKMVELGIALAYVNLHSVVNILTNLLYARAAVCFR